MDTWENFAYKGHETLRDAKGLWQKLSWINIYLPKTAGNDCSFWSTKSWA